jgi:probable rRNA maturation factor
VIIEFVDEQDEPAPVDDLIRLAEIVLKSEGLDDAATVAISLVDEPTIAELNESHLGMIGPTDVLSFPIEDAVPGEPPLPNADGPPTQLGDVFIAPSVVRINAERNEVLYEDEMALMVVHGLLHLLGWDHVDDKDAEAMEKREAELLKLVGRDRP